jgi:hypothetical protein
VAFSAPSLARTSAVDPHSTTVDAHHRHDAFPPGLVSSHATDSNLSDVRIILCCDQSGARTLRTAQRWADSARTCVRWVDGPVLGRGPMPTVAAFGEAAPYRPTVTDVVRQPRIGAARCSAAPLSLPCGPRSSELPYTSCRMRHPSFMLRT